MFLDSLFRTKTKNQIIPVKDVPWMMSLRAMPVPSEDYFERAFLYTGVTNALYTRGAIYHCTRTGSGTSGDPYVYAWTVSLTAEESEGGESTVGLEESGGVMTLGTELVDGTGWTSTGWTSDFATGFVHTVGQSTPLRRTIASTGTNLYLIEFDIESAVDTGSPDVSRAFTVCIGNSERIRLYRSTGNQHFKLGLQSKENGDLEFIPCSVVTLEDSTDFVGTIKNISVKQITAVTPSTVQIKNIDDDVSTQMRQTALANQNTFMGLDSGAYCFEGDGNSAFGFEAGAQLTSGFWNTLMGYRAGYQTHHGSRNVAIGTYALKDSAAATRCIAIGTFSQEKNLDGYNNIAIGADSLQYATTGHDKIAIGVAALGSDDGDGGIAIGFAAGSVAPDFNFSIAIGEAALSPLDGGYANVAIGRYAMMNKTDGDENVAIGLSTMSNNIEGRRNVVLGGWAGEGPSGGTDYSYCVIIGRVAGNANEGNDNVFLGYGAGVANTTATGNVLIGKNAGSNLTTGSGNIIIGNGALAYGEAAYDSLVIGAYINGRTVTGDKKLLGIRGVSAEAALHLPAGNTESYGAPLKFSNGSLMTNPENGAVEYDGTNLYFTDNTGTRHTLAVVA